MCEHIYCTISFSSTSHALKWVKNDSACTESKCYVRHSCGLYRGFMDQDVEVLGLQVDLVHRKDSCRLVDVLIQKSWSRSD